MEVNMKTRFWLSAVATMAVSILPVPSIAETVATALTDLNVRAGPGPEHAIIGLIRGTEKVVMIGCIEGSLWCHVKHRGQEGWAYSQYLATPSGGRRVIISETRDPAIPTITYGVTTGAAAPPYAVSGALVARPLEVATSVTVEPPAGVRTYVIENPVDPIYLNGEVVVGAGLPNTVRLSPVPNYDYNYVYVNRQPVLVEPTTRRIVYVYR